MNTRIVLLLLACCATVRAGTFGHKATNLHFPDQIGEWRKTMVNHFPDPKLGVEINYKSRGDAIASFVVYNGGVPKINPQ